MAHTHHHHHHHHHHHGDFSEVGGRRLGWAIGANVLLTLAQVIGGLVSGSLSLIADALHNFSDAASLLIALVAIKIGRKPSDPVKTFGYKRAETIAALINLTTLIIIGLYLIVEAGQRFFAPQPIAGWTVVIVAGVALIVDVFTALLTYRQSKASMNIKAAFLHNVTDALASVGVIITGTIILLYGWYWTDTVMTLMIAGYVLWQGFTQMPKVIHLLMEGTPEQIDIQEVTAAMEAQEGVQNVHHVHIWLLDEQRIALEAHVVIESGSNMDAIKIQQKTLLAEKFKVNHSTLEFEKTVCADPENC
jgi:cobalt-zinc-cadmium efflux system protein